MKTSSHGAPDTPTFLSQLTATLGVVGSEVGYLRVHGVEVIDFNQEVPGLANQCHRITKHLPEWQSALEGQPYAHRVWIQAKKGRLRLR